MKKRNLLSGLVIVMIMGLIVASCKQDDPLENLDPSGQVVTY